MKKLTAEQAEWFDTQTKNPAYVNPCGELRGDTNGPATDKWWLTQEKFFLKVTSSP